MIFAVPLHAAPSDSYSCIRGSDYPCLSASVREDKQLPTKATKLLTKLATKLMKALKGRDMPAQGNALGNEAKTNEP